MGGKASLLWYEETSNLENVYLAKHFLGIWKKFPGTNWKLQVDSLGHTNWECKRNKPVHQINLNYPGIKNTCENNKPLILLGYWLLADKSTKSISHISQSNLFTQALAINKTNFLSIQECSNICCKGRFLPKTHQGQFSDAKWEMVYASEWKAPDIW